MLRLARRSLFALSTSILLPNDYHIPTLSRFDSGVILTHEALLYEPFTSLQSHYTVLYNRVVVSYCVFFCILFLISFMSRNSLRSPPLKSMNKRYEYPNHVLSFPYVYPNPTSPLRSVGFQNRYNSSNFKCYTSQSHIIGIRFNLVMKYFPLL